MNQTYAGNKNKDEGASDDIITGDNSPKDKNKLSGYKTSTTLTNSANNTRV